MSCLIIVLFWISKGQLPVFISLPNGCSKSPIIFILYTFILLSRVRCIYSHNESWVIKLFMQFKKILDISEDEATRTSSSPTLKLRLHKKT